MKKRSKYDRLNQDGIINLAVELINTARHEYDVLIEDGQYLEARYKAEQDSRGLVGHILAWTVDDNQYLLKEVIKRTSF